MVAMQATASIVRIHSQKKYPSSARCQFLSNSLFSSIVILRAKLGICVNNLFAVRRRLDMLSSNLMCLQKSLGIFDRVLDTPSRHNQADACFCARLFRIFGFALDTSARQCSNKFDIALAYSYFGFAEDTPARQNANEFAFCSRLFVSLDVYSPTFSISRAQCRTSFGFCRGGENGCRERTIKRKKNADQRTASRPSRKLSRSA